MHGHMNVKRVLLSSTKFESNSFSIYQNNNKCF